MSLDLDANGNVKLAPVMGWTVGPVAGTGVLARLEYAATPDQLKTGGEAIQFILTPHQALELADMLTKHANNVLQGRTPPMGTAD